MCCKVVHIDDTNPNHKYLTFHKYRSNLQMCQTLDTIMHLGPAAVPIYFYIYTQESRGPWRGACSALLVLPTSTTLPIAQYSSMMKASCVVLVSSLLLATLAVAGASSSSPRSFLGRHPELVLGRKGRELSQSSGYHYQHQSKHMEQHEVSSYSILHT